MRRTTLCIMILSGLLLSLTSCKTYYIPLDSFKQQFASFDTSDMREVITRGPLGGTVKYKTYPIDVIKCVDKKGNPVELINGPSIELRFTDTNSKKTMFYFDRIRVSATGVRGCESRIISGIQKTIPFSAIKKIEVQDGHKKYTYIRN